MRLEDFLRNKLIEDMTCLFNNYAQDCGDEEESQYWEKSANELNSMTLEALMKLNLDYVYDYELAEHLEILTREFVYKLNSGSLDKR